MPEERIHSMQEIDIEHDAIDEYFECITACSLSDEGIHCLTQCIDVHLKQESEHWSQQIHLLRLDCVLSLIIFRCAKFTLSCVLLQRYFPWWFWNIWWAIWAFNTTSDWHKNDITIILFGRDYWSKVIDFQLLADSGIITDDHLKLFQYADTALDAWQIIRQNAQAK